MALTLDGDNGISGINGSASTPAVQGTDTNTGLTFGTDTVGVVTGGTTRTTVDSGGRLLVGTSTARSNVSVVGAGRNYTPSFQFEYAGSQDNGASYLSYSASNYYPIITLGTSASNTAGTNALVSSGNDLGVIQFVGNDGTNFATAAAIRGYVDNTPGSGDMPGRLVFSTTADAASSPTERMRIRSNGNIGIGVNGYGTVRLAINGQSTTGSDYAIAVYNSASQDLFTVRNDGVFSTGARANSPYNLTTTSAANVHVAADGVLYRSTSSIRFKTDVETLDNQYADALLSCRPVWYRSTAPGDALHPDWGYWGFIAEEVAEIDPRLVFWKTHETEKDEDGNTVQVELEEPIAEGVQYDRFVPHLLNLIKRQKEQLESQAATIASLEARLTALEGGAA